MRRMILSVALFLVANCLSSSVGHASWKLDGTPVTNAANDQQGLTAVSDGAGGVIVAWIDNRNGSANSDIYVQRINAAGVAQWTANGVVVCNAANIQVSAGIATDGAGGAIVGWVDNRISANSDIYAQRVNASGVPLWTANGVAICSLASNQTNARVVSDELGGAVIVWQDYRSGSADIYAQRINASGVAYFTANGNAVSNALSNQENPVAVSDGAGGAWVAWEDFRNLSNWDMYFTEFHNDGTSNSVGTGVGTGSFDQIKPVLATDGAGKVMLFWQHGTAASTYELRANLSAGGTGPFTLSSIWNGGYSAAYDGAGGWYLAWGTGDIYVQRVNASGNLAWGSGGVVVCNATGSQGGPQLLADGTGGCIVTWVDPRNDASGDVYAQRINVNGVGQWATNGVPLCTANGAQNALAVAADGNSGAIAVMSDTRNGSSIVQNTDIYAQRVEFGHGYWGNPAPAIASVSDIKKDQGGKVKINWAASDEDVDGARAITHYSVWRATDVLPAADASALVSSPSKIGAGFHGTAFYRDRTPATDYYWEWLGNQDAVYNGGYSWAAETRVDSTAGQAGIHYFQVIAHTTDNFVLFKSSVASGYSVDNLAPAAPLYLTAQRAGSNVNLKWRRVRVADLKKYTVYRKTSAGVTPIALNFLSDAVDTVLVDAGAPATPLYYIVTAADIHGNQGLPSNEASVTSSTGVAGLPPITSVTVLQNRPNPFASGTTFELGLPSAERVEVEVFDVAGRRVTSHSLGQRAAGWQSVQLKAKDDAGRDLASGVYFYRITAGGKTLTRKMVIAR